MKCAFFTSFHLETKYLLADAADIDNPNPFQKDKLARMATVYHIKPLKVATTLWKDRHLKNLNRRHTGEFQD